MTEHWDRIKALFDAALEVPPDERDDWLAAAAADEAVVAEVRSLLRYDERAGGASGLAPRAADRLRTRIGAYELMEIAGSGGMGTVYRAERRDEEFNKQVAIKLIKPGMDSEHIVRRFRHERQVLANLEHPGIARLIDGGMTDDGRPYLVMEYVDGVPVDEWCETKQLSVHARLGLFRHVCSAVQHAHQNLVVHRDLKPANIVVNAAGEVKLLDFGISKMLTSDATERGGTLTLTETGPMTPRYASPEQVSGGAITTATDIYALGVLLYELLTGRRPYQFSSQTREEMQRLVCETDPPLPSTAIPKLAGDLDTIVMKAMHKDPVRRYASAAQLGEDIRRHLVGLPVIARRDTLAYRMSRFVGRHPMPVAAGAVAVAALVVGFVVSTALFIQARAAEREATRRFEQARAFARTMMFDVYDQIEVLPGATPVRAFVVETTLEYLDALAAEAGDDAGLHEELGAGYHRMAALQGMDTTGNIGNVGGAVISARKSVRHRRAALELAPDSIDARANLASAYRTVGDVLAKQGRAEEARDAYEIARQEATAILLTVPGNVAARRQMVTVALKLGDLRETRGEIDAARREYAVALESSKELASSHPGDREFWRDYVIALGRQGLFEIRHGDLDAARPHLEEMLDGARSLAEAHPDNAQLRRDLAIAYERLGDLEIRVENVEAALVHYEAELAIFRAQIAADPANAYIEQSLSIATEKVADVNFARERFSEALAGYEQCLALTGSLSERDPTNRETRFYVGLCHLNVGKAHRALGAPAAAEASYRRMMTICQELLEADPDAANFLAGFAAGAVHVGEIAIESGRLEAAIAVMDDARETALVTLERNPDRPWAQTEYGNCCHLLARAYEQRGGDETSSNDARLEDLRAARRWYEQCLEMGGLGGVADDVLRCTEAIAALTPSR